jgi:UTP-glucose-1-phosphate uridylyltransferase
VLVARAFNRIYDLKLTVRGEMELAYMGEITTPSRCGRLDQGCAYGNRPIIMTFDGDRLDVREVTVGKPLYFVIVDLMAGKDTREILTHLNRCYPFAENETHRQVQKYLGPINAAIVAETEKALRAGDAMRIGQLMTEAQDQFDRHLQPACPTQLTAPVLHKILNHPALQPYIHGGKGVGSQGDGCAQFICKDEASQNKLVEIAENTLNLPALKLVIQPAKQLRKALIPAAGFGTRLFPATKAVKKELFPVVDRNGRAKPVILAIVEEALSAGVEEIGIIVQKQDLEVFQEIFCTPPSIENYNKLSKENQKYCDYLMDIGHHITFLTQDTQEGFGHAVYSAKEWAGNEPFLLMLGDHLYASPTSETCARQMVDAYNRTGKSVVGVKAEPVDVVRAFGCVTGTWDETGRLLSITEFAEKPDPEYAAEHLRMEGMPENEILTVFGQYILDPKIFQYLEENIQRNLRERGEFQLTTCLERLRREEGFIGLVVRGQRFDIGSPEAYRQTVIDFRNS